MLKCPAVVRVVGMLEFVSDGSILLVYDIAFFYALAINRDEESNAVCGMALIKGRGAGEAIVMQYLIAQRIGWVLPKAQIAGIKLTIDLGLDLDRAIV